LNLNTYIAEILNLFTTKLAWEEVVIWKLLRIEWWTWCMGPNRRLRSAKGFLI